MNISSTVSSRRSRGFNAAFAVAALTSSALLLACGGGNSSALAGGAGGEGGAGETSGGKSGVSGKPSTTSVGGDSGAGEGGAAIVNCDERPTETVELNQAIWQTGFKVTLGTATLKPQTPSCSPGILTVDAQFENRGTETETFDARTLLSSAGADYELPPGQDLRDVPGGRLGKGSFVFSVDDTFSLDDAVLSFGGAGRHQAKVPFGKDSPDPLITLEPQMLPIKGKVVAGNLTINFEDAIALADAPGSYSSLAADEVILELDFSATYTGTYLGGISLWPENLDLQLPDGTSIAPDRAPIETLNHTGAVVKGLWARFVLPTPVSGKYVLRAHGGWAGKTNLDHAEASFPFMLPSFPSFGDK